MNVLFYKNILVLEYGNIYFNWLADIREYKYFLQLLLLNICNRNLFLSLHFETSFDLLFKSSFLFGCMSMANFSRKHKEHCFLMFGYGGAVQIISHTNVGVSFLLSLFSKHNWRELCCSNNSPFKMIGCDYNIFAF